MNENKNKITKIIIPIVVVLVVMAGGYFIYSHFWGDNSGSVTKKAIYTCTMHRQIRSEHPGQCPICGMDLVLESSLEKKDDVSPGNDSTAADVHAVKLSPSQQVLANVRTEKVRTMEFAGEKTFNGYVKMSEKNFSHIATAIAGEIRTMYVNFEGQSVTKGQPVIEIYSPELVSTQKEYLLALNNLQQVRKSGNIMAIEQAASLVDASKQRLLLFEMTHAQIDELERTQKVKTTITEYARFSGVVTKKYVHVGHWATAGEDIYDVADLSTVWVIANVYESDMQYIKTGQTAQISSSAYPNEEIAAKINFINPVFNQESRTMEVRIDVSNKGQKLKPDMYVKVKLNTYAQQTIGVPKNAVIRTGERNIVYVEKETGVYEPREITIGYEQDGYYAVTSGLKEGESVVSSGGFLIDSETQIEQGSTSGHKHGNDNGGQDSDKDMKINPDQDIMKDMDMKSKK
jgi:Cu(I)/Ag(I) efflux system membrane fusion protein